MTYTALAKRPRLFDRMVGVTVDEFERLHDKFLSSWKRFEYEEFVKGKDRQRAFGGGNQEKLKSTEDKLVFILMYVRIYPVQLVMGMWYGISESAANKWIHRLMPLLHEALGYEQVLPKRTRGRNLEEIITEFPELKEFLLDITEQPVRRPKDKQKQREQYSGKKKRHTKKRGVISSVEDLRIHWISKTRDGTVHDKRLVDEEELNCEEKIQLGTDLGLLGLEIGEAKIIYPAKKPKGKELSEGLKNQNTALSRVRVRVEHAIRGVKRSHIAADIYRNMKYQFDDLTFQVAAGLHNLRVKYRYVHS